MIKAKYKKQLLKTTFIVSFLLVGFHTYSQSTIELLQADYTEFDAELVDAERVVGNVKFKHDGVLMDCDSAYLYKKENKIEAFGNIYIRQPDSFYLRGKHLFYDGVEKKARVEQDVSLMDDQMRLETSAINYDINQKIGYYTKGGKIRNGADRLRSRVGQYNSRSKTFYFKDSVVLTNPEYTMDADTLHYNSVSKIARFYGPTYITSEENTIFCNYGWYNTRDNLSQFSKGVYIEGENNKLYADSMVYNRNTGLGKAFGNLELIDTLEDVRIFGEEGHYNRFSKTTRIMGQPLAVKYYDGDSLLLMADTLIDFTDTSDNSRSLLAYHKATIYSADMQGVADSLSYSFSDSIIKLFLDPVLWSEANQITGDTLFIFQVNNQLNRMHVRKNAFIISEDTLDRFNQIKGRNMVARFSNNELKLVDVQGNGQSVYYAKEDSAKYTGVNSIVCSNMLIEVDSNTVKEITFYSKPEGTFYPIEDFPVSKRKLSKFEWLIDKKPEVALFLSRYRIRHKE